MSAESPHRCSFAHTANSIAADAVKCSYYNADLLSGTGPKWLDRNEPSSISALT
jgi:hypothetical protein